jgi:drug/metabolite transporter (DMT)-like permease
MRAAYRRGGSRAKKAVTPRFPRVMKIFHAILIKLVSVLLFACMSALIRWLGDRVPLGEVVFFRSAAGIIPVVLVYAWRHELDAAVRTSRPFGHIGRGVFSVASMFLNFAALARLPLLDATAIGFAAPLFTVALAALLLKERVQLHRWLAVMVGFVGVIVMLWPYLNLVELVAAGSTTSTVGILCALGTCFASAGAVIQTRRLTDSETTAAIVFYFSLICAIVGAVTLPFAWYTPDARELAALVAVGVLGGISHILLTESYRYAPASVVAPFDYTALLWAFLFGFWLFGEVPTLHVFVGSVIVIASGLHVIWRERRRRIDRARKSATETPPTGE